MQRTPQFTGSQFPAMPRLLVAVFAALFFAQPAHAMLYGSDHSAPPLHLKDIWGLTPAQASTTYTISELQCTSPDNILYPSDSPTFTFRLTNKTNSPIQAAGHIDIISYALRTEADNVFQQEMISVAPTIAEPISVDIPANGTEDITFKPSIPSRFGGYALIADIDGNGRALAAGCIRTFESTGQNVEYPVMSLDNIDPTLLDRIGIHDIRIGPGYVPTTDPNFGSFWSDLTRQLNDLKAHHITVLFMIGAGGPQPLGQMRSFLDSHDSGPMGYPGDGAWLPSSDPDFQQFCYKVASTFGWPNGPVTAFSLWNEPWEGDSISGWGADMLRYREMYTRMYAGVNTARTDSNVDVLVGGCDSSSNAMDKLFCDGTNKFLPMFDFVSLHYQGLGCPAIYPMWNNRQGPHGRVKLWDTESWVANSDDRVAAVLASWRAAGYDRLMGVDSVNISDRVSDKIQTWSVAAAEAATAHFLGDRPFRQIVFRNGLPWVYQFDGLQDSSGKVDPEDGTIVVVGDLQDGARAPFYSVHGLKEESDKLPLYDQLSKMAVDDPARPALKAKMAVSEVLSGATMTLPSSDDYSLYDFYGNQVPSVDGRIFIPLNSQGYFLRSNGRAGGFAHLLIAVKSARIDGYEPVQIVAHDFLKPVSEHPTLLVTLTDVLNRPVHGELNVTIDGLRLSSSAVSVSLSPNSSQSYSFVVASGDPVASNSYPLTAKLITKNDGSAVHMEDMHVNVIAKRTIAVDGDLSDWDGVLPQPVYAPTALAPSLTEKAWHPNMAFASGVTGGFSTGYLAYDSKNFYFAARVADSAPDPGTLRFATRDEDADYYPATVYKTFKDGSAPQQLVWPAGVRRYTYRRDPVLPAGNFPDVDNVQIAFNVIPDMDEAAKGTVMFPPGAEPGYIDYKDTDYEYALNKIAAKYGGGTEIWRLLVPGMPRKQFYPRQPRSPQDGPVTAGKLVIKNSGNTIVYECAIPWSEIPLVHKALVAGQTIKFSYRVNSASSTDYELAHDRSVSKSNGFSFHCDWVGGHWANEVQFAFQK